MSNEIKLDEFIFVAGGGGFIGGELVRHLRQQGCRRIGAIDIKPLDEWFQRFPDVENVSLMSNHPSSAAQSLVV